MVCIVDLTVILIGVAGLISLAVGVFFFSFLFFASFRLQRNEKVAATVFNSRFCRLCTSQQIIKFMRFFLSLVSFHFISFGSHRHFCYLLCFLLSFPEWLTGWLVGPLYVYLLASE